MFSCLYLVKRLVILFKVCFPAFKMQSFSARQRLHCFPPLLYAFARFKIDHLILYFVFASFNTHMYLWELKWIKYIRELKEAKTKYKIKCSILKRANAYWSGGKQCNLCLAAKLCILKAGKHTLNKRTELLSKCRHENKPP